MWNYIVSFNFVFIAFEIIKTTLSFSVEAILFLTQLYECLLGIVFGKLRWILAIIFTELNAYLNTAWLFRVARFDSLERLPVLYKSNTKPKLVERDFIYLFPPE